MAAITFPHDGRTYSISSKKLYAVAGGDEKNAVSLKLWQKIADFFQHNRRAEAYKAFYNMIHSGDGWIKPDVPAGTDHDDCNLGMMTTFDRLKKYANEKNQSAFTVDFDTDDYTLTYFIDCQAIKTESVVDFLNSVSIKGKNLLNEYSRIVIDHIENNEPPEAPESTQVASGSKSKKHQLMGADALRGRGWEIFIKYPALASAFEKINLPELGESKKLSRRIERLPKEYRISEESRDLLNRRVAGKNGARKINPSVWTEICRIKTEVAPCVINIRETTFEGELCDTRIASWGSVLYDYALFLEKQQATADAPAQNPIQV